MTPRFARGLELGLRAGSAPLVLGLRWLNHRRHEGSGAPLPSWSPRLFSKVALDEIFFATELLSAALVSPNEHRVVMREVDEALELYEARGWLADPARYHESPPPAEAAGLTERRPPWGAYRHLRFDSGYEPDRDDPARGRWLRFESNRTAHAWLLEHPGRPRPWLVCVPGYRMGRPLVDFVGFRVRWLHRELGLNVAIPVMPLHGPRRVGRRGGDGFFTGNFVDTVHAQAQALWDVRRLIGWLRAQRAPAVGAYGVSLGGYTAALLACVEEDLACVIAGIPAADFLRLMQAHAPPFLMRAAERAGFRFERIERLLRLVSPLALPPLLPRERRYLYAGIADRLASPDHALEIWKHWEQPRLAWYQGGHVSFLWEPEVKALLAEAFRDCGLSSSGSAA